MKSLLLAWMLLGAEGFQEVSETDGIRISARKVSGSRFPELRLEAFAEGDLERVCARAFGDGKIEPGESHVLSRKVLSESTDERVTHDELDPPMISKRDYVVRRSRTRPSPSTCRVDFSSLDDAPERKGWVRLRRLFGSTRIERLADGRLRIEYRIHSDPGGSLPAWLVESESRKVSLSWFRMLLADAKKSRERESPQRER